MPQRVGTRVANKAEGVDGREPMGSGAEVLMLLINIDFPGSFAHRRLGGVPGVSAALQPKR